MGGRDTSERHDRFADRQDGPRVEGWTRRRFLTSLAAGTVAARALGLPSWARPPPFPPADEFDAEVAADWFDLSLQLVKTTGGYSPPVASRAFGYAGLTLYEALVPGMDGYRSLGRGPH